MTREFEGRTEQEAVAKAVEELKMDEGSFEVEVIDEGRAGLFFKRPARIRVTVEDGPTSFEQAFEDELSRLNNPEGGTDGDEDDGRPDVDPETADKIVQFLDKTLGLMGYEASITAQSVKGGKLTLSIESDSDSIIIGRKGKNLDALQVVTNAFANRLGSDCRVVLDSENYRLRREAQIVRMASRAASQVRRTGRSQLLDPMNPYERRLVHTALNDVTGIETKSEGEGLFKQVRIYPTKKRF